MKQLNIKQIEQLQHLAYWYPVIRVYCERLREYANSGQWDWYWETQQAIADYFGWQLAEVEPICVTFGD